MPATRGSAGCLRATSSPATRNGLVNRPGPLPPFVEPESILLDVKQHALARLVQPLPQQPLIARPPVGRPRCPWVAPSAKTLASPAETENHIAPRQLRPRHPSNRSQIQLDSTGVSGVSNPNRYSTPSSCFDQLWPNITFQQSAPALERLTPPTTTRPPRPSAFSSIHAAAVPQTAWIVAALVRTCRSPPSPCTRSDPPQVPAAPATGRPNARPPLPSIQDPHYLPNHLVGNHFRRLPARPQPASSSSDGETGPPVVEKYRTLLLTGGRGNSTSSIVASEYMFR